MKRKNRRFYILLNRVNEKNQKINFISLKISLEPSGYFGSIWFDILKFED